MVIQTIPEHYPIMYERSFMQKLQQMTNKLRGTVKEKSGGGESIKYSRLGVQEMVDIVGRGGDTVATDLPTEHRWIRPTAAEVVNRFDEFDAVMLGEIVLPDSETVTNQAYAVARKIDNVIIAAMTGTAFEGETGLVPVTLPAGQQIAINYVHSGSPANSGLTLRKVVRAKYLLDANEVPDEGRYIGFTARQEQDLINDILTNHSDDAASMQWVSAGRIMNQPLMGFTPVRCERFLKNVNTRSAVAWQKDQVGLGVWTDRKVYMDVLPTKRHSLQIRTVLNIGATRIEEKGVVEIFCDES